MAAAEGAGDVLLAEDCERPSALTSLLDRVTTGLQRQLDRTTIFVRARWSAWALLTAAFLLRVYFLAGYYIVTYALGIYLLQQTIGFLSPLEDPDADATLPTREGEEFRPFSRKLSEFKFWQHAFFAVCGAHLTTFFAVFDMPVFWPILLAYFLQLVFLTMKERVRHMIKHKYIPVSFGKKTYGDVAKVDVPPTPPDA